MLTLKDKINRILGDNVRLLLPSYWWKRVFGLVVDEVDRVEQKVNTKVNKSYVDKALSNKVNKSYVDNAITSAITTILNAEV